MAVEEDAVSILQSFNQKEIDFHGFKKQCEEAKDYAESAYNKEQEMKWGEENTLAEGCGRGSSSLESFHPDTVTRAWAIEERYFTFRGTDHFRTYNPDKYGLKAYQLCDSNNGYCCYFKLHGSKSREPSAKDKTYDIVTRLLEPYPRRVIRCMAHYIFRERVNDLRASGVDFNQHLYVPEVSDGEEPYFDREDHGHVPKRLTACVRSGNIPGLDRDAPPCQEGYRRIPHALYQVKDHVADIAVQLISIGLHQEQNTPMPQVATLQQATMSQKASSVLELDHVADMAVQIFQRMMHFITSHWNLPCHMELQITMECMKASTEEFPEASTCGSVLRGVQEANVPVELPETPVDAAQIRDYVAVVYEKKWYIGVVEAIDDGEYNVRFMQQSGDKFKWPRTTDDLWVKPSNPSEQKDAIRERNKEIKERQDQGLVSKPYNMSIHGTEEEQQDLKLKLKTVCNKMGESLWKKPTYREVISRALSSWLKSHDDENDHRLAVRTSPAAATKDKPMFLTTETAINHLSVQLHEHARSCPESMTVKKDVSCMAFHAEKVAEGYEFDFVSDIGTTILEAHTNVVLDLLHEGHLGQEKTKTRARDILS
ncbi:hypothetical protein Bbelb_425400 [Branchiostoma belcheri]|nr:hypothetical protein Bbelb_425400 [Branchiostoma belcheri]